MGSGGQPSDVVNLSNGLIAHYKFEGNAIDSSGNGNHGTEYGGVSYVSGVNGQGVSFDGVDDTITRALNLNTNVFTVSAWVSSSDNRSDPIIQLNDGDGDGAFQLAYGNNQVYIGQGYVGSNSVALNSSQFNHLIATSDGATLKLYMNGIYTTGISSKCR